jgi:hypothetical protein
MAEREKGWGGELLDVLDDIVEKLRDLQVGNHTVSSKACS